MIPQGHHAQDVPLQVEGYGGHPGGQTVVQYTAVNVTTEPPKDHIIWSLFNFVYLNSFCLGLAALIFSIKARDRKVAGDLNGARQYSSTACCINVCATVFNSIFLLICIILFIIMQIISNSH